MLPNFTHSGALWNTKRKRESMLTPTFQKAMKTRWPWIRVQLLDLKWDMPNLTVSKNKFSSYICTPYTYRIEEKKIRWILLWASLYVRSELMLIGKTCVITNWSFTTVVLQLDCESKSPQELYRLLSLIQYISGRVQEFSFLTIPRWCWSGEHALRAIYYSTLWRKMSDYATKKNSLLLKKENHGG